MAIRYLFLAFLFQSSKALVQQVPLCDDDDCPMVSQIGLGCLHLGDKIGGISDAETVNAWVLNAVTQGITLFDTADVYPVVGGTNGDAARLLGEALALTPGLRENITIVCKMDIIPPSSLDTSREHLTYTVNWFLDALQTTYLDVILLHFPDSFMDASEVASTFHDFKTNGLVNYFGTSNHYPSHRKALENKMISQYNMKLVTNEVEVSVWNPRYLNYNNDVVDDSVLNGYRILAWGALGGNPLGGFNRLFGRHGIRQERIIHALKEVGKVLNEDEDITVIAIAWLLSHSAGFIPLIGTTQIDRVNTIVQATNYKDSFTPSLWWKIADAGGVCSLADIQCDYEGYRAHKVQYLPKLFEHFLHNRTSSDSFDLDEEEKV